MSRPVTWKELRIVLEAADEARNREESDLDIGEAAAQDLMLREPGMTQEHAREVSDAVIALIRLLRPL